MEASKRPGIATSHIIAPKLVNHAKELNNATEFFITRLYLLGSRHIYTYHSNWLLGQSFFRRCNLNILVKILTTFSSAASIGFGIWHFFVPGVWKWYSYIDHNATELILAVRAINIFFSLSLVLFGALNILFIWSGYANRFSVIVLLGATGILWLTRVVLQLIHPQGSNTPFLQSGMLTAFILITLGYLVALGLIMLQKYTVP